MKTYIVYSGLTGRELGLIKAGSLNAAEKKAAKIWPGHPTFCAYTEV